MTDETTASAYDEPLRVELFDNEVILTAPRGSAAVVLTKAAARETARRIVEVLQADETAGSPPP